VDVAGWALLLSPWAILDSSPPSLYVFCYCSLALLCYGKQ